MQFLVRVCAQVGTGSLLASATRHQSADWFAGLVA
jgi:hypothetical protein